MEVKIYVDGACSNNGKVNAKGGYGVYFPNEECGNISEPFVIKPITNQRAELYAIYKALKSVEGINYDKVVVYSDSKYSVNCITKWYGTWVKNNFIGKNKKPILNLDIINDIMALTNDKITYVHIPREQNQEADKLAKDGAK